jgi:hypothetical protein
MLAERRLGRAFTLPEAGEWLAGYPTIGDALRAARAEPVRAPAPRLPRLRPIGPIARTLPANAIELSEPRRLSLWRVIVTILLGALLLVLRSSGGDTPGL